MIPTSSWGAISKGFGKYGDKIKNLGKKLFSKSSEMAYAAKELAKLPSKNTKNIIDLEKKVSEWLGQGTKIIKNKAEDVILLSKDGLRKVRFDLNRPDPHTNPHAHIEELVNDIWQKSGQYFL
ncbi:hypothetical protein pah_c034o001 [Parachlamydia acanthamoebae str. Hall's coccus]|nr:hypothetical protein pah_c034o001 [Parachlamydia acanthamoebae str. Hall's coccus]